jgi:hypothetical protein
MLRTIPFYVYMMFWSLKYLSYYYLYYYSCLILILEGSWNRRSLNKYLKKELNIAWTSSLVKIVSHDSSLNLLIKSDIVFLLIFLMVLDFCVGVWEYSVLIINKWASWSDKPFKIGIIVYLSNWDVSVKILSVAVAEVFELLLGD